MHRYVLFLFCSLILSQACVDIEQVDNADELKLDGEFAIPLVNSSISVADITENENTDGVVFIDSEGKVTVRYAGDVIERQSFEVFPPIPGVQDFPLLDTSTFLDLPFIESFKTRKMVLRETMATFKFNSQFLMPVTVKVTIPRMVKDGEVFERNYTLQPGEAFATDPISLLDWTINADLKEIEVVYDARLPDGERVKLDYAAIGVDFLIFKYAEVFFGSQLFDIQGDLITLGVFDNWQSGGVSFVDPKVRILVDNSFGFPTRSRVNQLDLITADGRVLPLESEFINTGINFGFPSFDEVGQVITTDFVFDKSNSNIDELFKERIVQVNYDVDALAFPDNNPDEFGFVTNESFFRVRVEVELPMQGTVNDLQLYQEYDIEELDIDFAEEVELKTITSNTFPIDIELQAYFLDVTGFVLDSLYVDGPTTLVSNESGDPTNNEITEFITLQGERLEDIKSARKVGLKIGLSNPESDEPFWILADQQVSLRMGAKVKVNID